MSFIYHGVPFEWDQPNNEFYPGNTIRVIERAANGAVKNRRRATDEEVRTVMILQAVAQAAPTARTPAYKYDPHPFNYGEAIRVTPEELGLKS